MSKNDHSPTPTPSWWREDHNTGWERVKAAVHRDWEQTRSDITAGREGTDLNQNADDTFGQAFGSKPIPRGETANPMTAHELDAHVRRAARAMNREAEHSAAEARVVIAGGVTDTLQAQLEAREADRLAALEVPFRYGHGAAAHYDVEWGAETEARLRDEWVALHPGRDWGSVRDAVHHGWSQWRG